MKRRIIVMIVAVMAAGAAGACSDRAPTGAGAEGADKASPWVRPPMIDGVLRDGGGLVVRGAAGPNARVVLRAVDAAAVAVNADAAGRFDLRLPPLNGDVVFTPEVQVGEDAAVSPETLVVVQGGAGPIVLIAAGQPTIRLDGMGVLDAVDPDGATLLISGQAGPKAPAVVVDGAAATPTPTTRGRWRAVVGRTGAGTVTVDGRSFDYPGGGGGGGAASGAGPVIARAGQGWRIDWPVAPGGRQSAWLPDRPVNLSQTNSSN